VPHMAARRRGATLLCPSWEGPFYICYRVPRGFFASLPVHVSAYALKILPFTAFQSFSPSCSPSVSRSRDACCSVVELDTRLTLTARSPARLSVSSLTFASVSGRGRSELTIRAVLW